MDTNSVLVISPHPDDLEIGMGGTVAKLIERGVEVVSLVATDGSGSTTLSGLSREELAETRLQEARKAALTLGIQFLIPLVLHNLKSEENKRRFRNGLREAVIKFTPREIYMPHPETDRHPTHRIASRLALGELKDLLSANKDLSTLGIWCYEVWTPFDSYNRIEDISQYVDLKIRAIETHRSQIEYKNYTDGILGLNRYRAVFDERHGLTEMKHAEAFIELKL